MALLSEVKYETEIKDLKDISSESVLSMLRDVRENIGNLDPSITNQPLRNILEYVEKGSYDVKGNVSTIINLSSASGIVKAYRKYSEGGCQSCVNLGQETIDAQDASSGWYCSVSDPDYIEHPVGSRSGVRYSGFSPKVRKHYENPCTDWKPRFPQKLDELLKEE